VISISWAGLRRGWRRAGPVLGVAVAASGQMAIMSEKAWRLPVLTPLADALFSGIFSWPTSVLVGVLLLAAGGGLFAATVDSGSGSASLGGSLPDRPRPPRLTGRRRWRTFAGMLVLGSGISAILWLLLGLGNYEGFYPWLWVTGIAIVGAGFLYLDVQSGADLKFRIGALEVAVVLIATAAFIALNLKDINDWYYSVSGDEYVIFGAARDVANGFRQNFFSLRGAYDILPVAETYYRAGVMTLFGVNYFGWKFSGVLAGAALFAPLYFLVRNLFDVRTAVAAVGLLAAAHVLVAHAHTGYDNLFALAPTALAFALFFSGIKRGSAFLTFGAGAAAGLGFYVFHPARIILLILLLFLLLYRSRVDLKRDLALIGFGFVLVVMPMVIVSNSDLITGAQDQSVFGYDPGQVGDPWERIKDNALRNTVAFNYQTREAQFISGSLLEPITAVLAVLGLAYALRHFKRPALCFLLIWYAFSMLIVGIASPHPYVPTNRINFMIPVMLVFAALGSGKAYGLFQDIAGRNNLLKAVGPPLALAVVLLAVAGSNLYRFWYVTPRNYPTPLEAVAVKAALSSECRDRAGQTVVVAPGTLGSLYYALDARDLGDETPVILAYDEMKRVTEFPPDSCVVYLPDTEPPSAAHLARLRRLTGAPLLISEYDHSGEHRVIVLR